MDITDRTPLACDVYDPNHGGGFHEGNEKLGFPGFISGQDAEFRSLAKQLGADGWVRWNSNDFATKWPT
ncbi:hypothetical protein [Saccharomonospora cyanea]|uniref:hypothetical protein n=1 Tax=Saccharomonospora cyanea TaxID=40989 RepID=UPI0012F8CF26|nr:hypothetical protein [Saccharomonospora cyanea]